jgi:hypothetical protein
LPPDARLARLVLGGEALTRLSPTLEAERANGDLSFRIKTARRNFFNADQVQMRAKHADGPERIIGGLPFARFPAGHGEGAEMTIPDGSFSLYPSACLACICR